ncbi:MAG TPA: crosslink repair DNA glycosylase YcaQ family protein [Thermoanaerobaculia bacterium]|nr:crosslink repair DNA glycosylase YcaQ family protein [Thermoanaerobaculia bacterium]
MKSIADVVRRAGWIHSAGGTGPYLSLRARIPSLTRQQVDYSVCRDFDLVEVLAVRESMMLVPREDVAVALAAGRRGTIARFSRLPIDAEELDALAQTIIEMIGDRERTAGELRSCIPSRLIADLGDEGKRAGFGSTLPVALRLLQSQGRILRTGEHSRLDAKRYSYRRWPSSIPIGEGPRDLDAALAERFARWVVAPGVDDFAFFAGTGKTAAKKALAAAPSTGAPPPLAKGVLLLPFRDPHFELRRDSDEATRRHNTIVADGELAGIWEFDPAEQRIVWRTFRNVRGVEAAVGETERFIRDELGDHKFYPFDHGKTRSSRLAALNAS